MFHLLDDPDALDEFAPTRQQVVPETLEEQRERIGDHSALTLRVPLPHGAVPRLGISNLSISFTYEYQVRGTIVLEGAET